MQFVCKHFQMSMNNISFFFQVLEKVWHVCLKQHADTRLPPPTCYDISAQWYFQLEYYMQINCKFLSQIQLIQILKRSSHEHWHSHIAIKPKPNILVRIIWMLINSKWWLLGWDTHLAMSFELAFCMMWNVFLLKIIKEDFTN